VPDPVLIVGGGVAALTTALSCRVRGVPARVFEQGDDIRIGGGALVMWSNAMAVLRQLGLESKIVAAGTVIERCVFHTTDGILLLRMPVGDIARQVGAPTVVVSRRALLGILATELGPEPVAFGHRCERFDTNAGVPTLQFSHGAVAKGRAVIGADGLHSVVRAQLLGPAPPERIGQTAWVGISPRIYDAFPAGIMVGFVGDDLRFWATRIGADSTYWYAIVKEPTAPHARRVDSRPALIEQLSTWNVPVAALIRDTAETETVRAELVHRSASDDWGRGPVTLIGDAAHPMTPDLGQGACQAIEGSAVLADCLAAQEDSSTAFREYERRRMLRTRRISFTSHEIARWSMPSFPVPSLMRQLSLRLISGLDEASDHRALKWILDAQPPALRGGPQSQNGS
jgi:2-polyprenyl-6-methoxyphenol hydroxylase-like FAD-dependent oxidoreductase